MASKTLFVLIATLSTCANSECPESNITTRWPQKRFLALFFEYSLNLHYGMNFKTSVVSIAMISAHCCSLIYLCSCVGWLSLLYYACTIILTHIYGGATPQENKTTCVAVWQTLNPNPTLNPNLPYSKPFVFPYMQIRSVPSVCKPTAYLIFVDVDTPSQTHDRGGNAAEARCQTYRHIRRDSPAVTICTLLFRLYIYI